MTLRMYSKDQTDSQADQRRRRVWLMCRIVVPESPGFKQVLERIDYRVRDVLSHVPRNSAKPVDYDRRHHKGQSISSPMAESAVNQVINARGDDRDRFLWGIDGRTW